MGKAVNKAVQGVSRAVGGNKNLAMIIGVVAAVAIPFAAPLVAGALLGSTVVAGSLTFALTSAAVGAAMGGVAGLASGSLTGTQGTSAMLGGVGGGVGGFLGGGGGEVVGNALFGPSTGAAADVTSAGYQGAESFGSAAGYQGATGPAYGAAEAITPGVAISPGGSEGVVAGGIGSAAAPPAITPAPGTSVSAPAPAPGATPGYTAPGPSGAVNMPAQATGSWGERFASGFAGNTKNPSITTAQGLGRAASGLVSPSGIMSAGQLAMTMFNKPPEGLTPQERAYLDETAALAGTNRQMFESRVAEARRLLARGTANPEQAYASASSGYQRRARSAGLRSPEDMRRAMLEGARAGSQAVPAEEGRAYSATVAGLSAMPGSAPAGPAAYALGPYRDVDQRQREYQANIGRSLGGLASAMGGRSSLYG
jgi:hypothetical protein